MKKVVQFVVGLVTLINAHAVVAAVSTETADPFLTAVKLAPQNPLAVLLDGALPLVDEQGPPLAFGKLATKKAFVIQSPQTSGYLITCTTIFYPSRVPDPVGVFQGCQIEEHDELEAGVLALTFKELMLKLGGTPVMTVPGSLFCHTRAC